MEGTGVSSNSVVTTASTFAVAFGRQVSAPDPAAAYGAFPARGSFAGTTTTTNSSNSSGGYGCRRLQSPNSVRRRGTVSEQETPSTVSPIHASATPSVRNALLQSWYDLEGTVSLYCFDLLYLVLYWFRVRLPWGQHTFS
ncbi:hypothetical protein GWI33_018505 [Rhynchophorus ferrugineus]|uniref:Uncharacterized protein n=1 Tax=Rhynchophorus ferrugineus TaxID=354439 RepID=A0A834HTL5_RHYFE|nr:hypothetical protein GWI33_018505 [Rhynchophorus ferrugineus]